MAQPTVDTKSPIELTDAMVNEAGSLQPIGAPSSSILSLLPEGRMVVFSNTYQRHIVATHIRILRAMEEELVNSGMQLRIATRSVAALNVDTSKPILLDSDAIAGITPIQNAQIHDLINRVVAGEVIISKTPCVVHGNDMLACLSADAVVEAWVKRGKNESTLWYSVVGLKNALYLPIITGIDVADEDVDALEPVYDLIDTKGKRALGPNEVLLISSEPIRRYEACLTLEAIEVALSRKGKNIQWYLGNKVEFEQDKPKRRISVDVAIIGGQGELPDALKRILQGPYGAAIDLSMLGNLPDRPMSI